ncbi:DMT family transporter [Undibacterium rugosum]|uniref:DMT family transporter n=1 Tax=Undibacterium rugosum TaxID=2762291 RepID=A0A923I7H6_9BURK|nr:DMT family transporter [Undibacterium rugosum]MBC3937046.1 DMT family transporter [Undibacterium rugosum]MBR7780267.1 DMT family transporter [Undibacterium rugosum]
MTRFHSHQAGVSAALFAAVLFGAGTPLAKFLLAGASPWMLAGLLYLGSGIGLTLYRLVSGAQSARLARSEALWFAGAVVSGGIVGPVLLMLGLSSMPASGASLLLNAEGVLTALLAWFAFKENFDRRIAFGMLAIVLGAAILSWPGQVEFASTWPSLAVLGACLSWGIDNNLTRKVSLSDATWIASVKGMVAGSVNLTLALVLGAVWPQWPYSLGAMVVGFLCYGVSLALFVIGLRHLGTARTGAYFSIAPFIGAILAVLLGEPVTAPLLLAGSLMALGIWLHLTEHHEHEHTHEEMEHEHEHVHDEHHKHDHEVLVLPGTKHSHRHIHEALTHSHVHYPDAHHRHEH